MQGQIAGATPLSQLFIYMNNCFQFCFRLATEMRTIKNLEIWGLSEVRLQFLQCQSAEYSLLSALGLSEPANMCAYYFY